MTDAETMIGWDDCIRGLGNNCDLPSRKVSATKLLPAKGNKGLSAGKRRDGILVPLLPTKPLAK